MTFGCRKPLGQIRTPEVLSSEGRKEEARFPLGLHWAALHAQWAINLITVFHFCLFNQHIFTKCLHVPTLGWDSAKQVQLLFSWSTA